MPINSRFVLAHLYPSQTALSDYLDNFHAKQSLQHLDVKTLNMNSDWKYLARHMKLTSHILHKYSEHWRFLWDVIASSNRSLTLELIQEFYDYISFKQLAFNPSIPLNVIEYYVNESWCMKGQINNGLSLNPHITWQFVLAHINKRWNWSCLSGMIKIEIEMFSDKILEWDYKSMSSNPTLTWKIVHSRENERWDWSRLMKHGNLLLDFYTNSVGNITNSVGNITNKQSHFHSYIQSLGTYHDALSENPNLKLSYVETHQYTANSWNYGKIVRSSHTITFHEVMKYKNLIPYAGLFSDNPNLTYKDVINNDSIRWDFYAISQNPCDRINAAVVRQRIWKRRLVRCRQDMIVFLFSLHASQESRLNVLPFDIISLITQLI